MPVCNECDIIAEVVDEWLQDVFAYLPKGSEFIFDDCSNDGTQVLLQELAKKHPFIQVNFSHRGSFFNTAMRLYRLAACPLVFFTDSDGQYVGAEFWKVAQYIDSYDMVHGYKFHRKDPLYRVAASAVFNASVRISFSSRGKDVNSAFRLIHRPLLEQILDQISHLPTLPNAEMYIRAEWQGFRIKNVPVQHRSRKYGKSRGLPLRDFPRECLKAYKGLQALRRELTAQPVTKFGGKTDFGMFI